MKQIIQRIGIRDRWRRPAGDRSRPTMTQDLEFAIGPEVRDSLNVSGFAILQARTGKIHLVNGLAACVWRGLKENRNRSEVITAIARDHSIPLAEVESAVAKLLCDFERRELVVRKPGKPRTTSIPRLVARAIVEFALYDFMIRVRGYRGIRAALERGKANLSAPVRDEGLTRDIVYAVSLASSLYALPVKCLQRSVVLARLLRTFGVPAEVVIGYRAVPFASHAWAEVDGRVVNDSAALPERMLILDRV